jgi:hypothetical protein
MYVHVYIFIITGKYVVSLLVTAYIDTNVHVVYQNNELVKQKLLLEEHIYMHACIVVVHNALDCH